MKRQRRRRRRLSPVRDRMFAGVNRSTVLFTTGMLGVAHETLIQHAERPTLLILFAAMMGLPAFLTPSNPGQTGFSGTDQIEDEIEEDEEVEEDESKD
jgi:hypothetical protein